MQKTGPQRVPPCRSLHLQLKIGISTCNKKQPFWLSCIFLPSFLSVFNCGWMVFNCDSHQSLSENRGSQSESNEDPIRAYQKREDLSKPYRSLGEELGFSIYYCKADRPPLKKKIGEGDPLNYCRCNIKGFDIATFDSLRVTRYLRITCFGGEILDGIGGSARSSMCWRMEPFASTELMMTSWTWCLVETNRHTGTAWKILE